MDWTNLWNTAIQFLQGFSAANKTSTPPATPTTNAFQPGADQAVAALQSFINQAAQAGLIQLPAPLKVDGWLGPKTDAAIMAAIARLKPLIGAP